MLYSHPLAPAAPPPLPFLPPIGASSASASSSLSPPALPPRPRYSLELRCEVALDPPELLRCADTWLDSIGLKGETASKAFLDLNAPRTRNSAECIQCVETSCSDTMHHCVPEWDVAGADLGVVLESADLFAPSKERWELGQSRKCYASDTSFVPDYDFEELCWEDGELVVVMQGPSTKCSRDKNFLTRASDRLALPSETCRTTGLTAGDVDGALDKVVTGDLIDSFAAGNSQEDELLSWLQHPVDDTPDKYGSDVLNESANPNIWNAYDKVYMTHGAPPHTFNAGHPSAASASRTLKLDVSLNRTSQNTVGGDQGDTFRQTDGVLSGGRLKGSNSTPSASTSSRQSLEFGPTLRRPQMPPPEVQQGIASSACAPSVQAGSPRSRLNFSNFSRPAAEIKANLQSISMASGPTGTERLKQLDRVAAAAGACNCESINSATKDASLTSAEGQGGALVTASNIPKNVQDFSVNDSVQSLFLREEADPAVSAEDPMDGNFKVVDISHGWISCVTSNVEPGTNQSTQAIEAAEPVTCYSGGSGNTASNSGKGAGGVVKRKVHTGEDSECQSKDPEDESADGKKTASERCSSLKRSRAAEIHNQSERRRRDRINEKMKALQELIPNCNKTDKASLLEEAIDYVKTLQTQVQMMSHRSGMSLCPMLIPQHVQLAQLATLPHMHMGMGMGMGMVDMTVAMPGRHILPMPPFSTTPFTCPMMPAVPGSTVPPASIPASSLQISEVSWAGVSPPGHQVLLPARPATMPGTHEPSHMSNMISPNFYISPQQHPSQEKEKQSRHRRTGDRLLATTMQVLVDMVCSMEDAGAFGHVGQAQTMNITNLRMLAEPRMQRYT